MSILDAIGNTPLVALNNINGSSKVKIFGKLEGSNPGGSVKDRAAYYMIDNAEKAGLLTKDKIIIEATSGNTGIALAMIGAAKGYRVKLFMPECVSTERRGILEAFGAQVVLTPAREKTDGAIKRAHQAIADDPKKYYMPDQFNNENNVLAHYETTAPEIFQQTQGQVDVFAAGMGTTGTLMGVGRYLKSKKPSVKIVGVEPVQGHAIQGLKNMTESIVPRIYNPKQLDAIEVVEDGQAFETTEMLARNEGIFVGMSSGAALAGALNFAKKMDSGTIVVLLPDRGDRYLSTMLFKSICSQCPP